MAKFNDEKFHNWILVKGWVGIDVWDLYLCAFYWTVTTITTVGYGDISAYNVSEMAFCSIAMVIGVFLYSFTIGSLSTLLLNLDSEKQKLNAKLELLHELGREFDLATTFYNRLAGALEYEHKQNKNEIKDLLDSLPFNLRN